VIGYIDPTLTEPEKQVAKAQLEEDILSDLNYVEISIRSTTSQHDAPYDMVSYYIDNLQLVDKKKIINDLVDFSPGLETFRTTPIATGCPSGFAGKFSFNATLINRSDKSLSNLTVQVKSLTNGNLLQNADGGPGGVGAILTVPKDIGLCRWVIKQRGICGCSLCPLLKAANEIQLFCGCMGIAQ